MMWNTSGDVHIYISGYHIHLVPMIICNNIYIIYIYIYIYTAQTGLPYFDRAAVTANGTWLYGPALVSMGGELYFRCRLVNIGPIYKQ